MSKTKKEYRDDTRMTAEKIIPRLDGSYDIWELISRSGERPFDAIYKSLKECFEHHSDTCDERGLENDESFFCSGGFHKDKLSLKEMMERYPNNFWENKVEKGAEIGGMRLVFCNVDYSTVKVTSKIDQVVTDVPEHTTYTDGSKDRQF